MENVLKYYEFSEFIKDNSEAFSNNEIAYTELNETHYLIFEKEKHQYNLYVSKYSSKSQIGKEKPEILEILVENYDKSIPAHRLAITQYLK
ncbi:hypothetical protein [Polaribacter sp.]|jgi:hypothetical protein|uniref:hypothetical protein n=1 Tax=Polaribacter sp. TaxID=1920175 RepID=UPI0025E114D5|nr:hypothetical protein [Polaribacter sp.]